MNYGAEPGKAGTEMSEIYKMFLEREKQTLSPFAFLTANTRGRENPCPQCPNRTDYRRTGNGNGNLFLCRFASEKQNAERDGQSHHIP